MKVYHPKFELLSYQMAVLGYGGTSLNRQLWSMARTKELGPVQFKMLAELANKFEQERADGS